MGQIITEINQIGIITPDIEKSIEAFSKLGLDEWSPVFTVTSEGYEDMRLDGEPCEYGSKCATCNMLDIELELIEPLDDKSDYARFLERNGGPGIHHLSIETEDYDEVLNSGRKELIAGTMKGTDMGWKYFDYKDDLGLVLEFFPG